MPNIKAAIKRVRRVKTQTLVNRVRKSKYRLAIKKMNLLILEKKKAEALKFLPKLNSHLMKISKTSVVNKKTASRNISRISKIINKIK